MSETTNTTKPKFWVGLGASAGGLEALRGMARNLPNNLPVTYIVAQHMAPHHKSMLSEIIGRETEMPVLDVTDKLVPEANTIYITPPNQNIIVDGEMIRLTAPSKEPGAPKPSVDVFLESLAEEKKDYAIGIILSGTGSDGAKGIAAVSMHGGITIAQDELTAKYSSMPTAALQSGMIDLVMSPEEIGSQIPKITAMPRDLDALRASTLNTDGISELVRLLLEQTKVNFRHYKTATFQRRVERRMAAHSTDNLDDYVTIAKASQTEVQALFQDLLISVTSFFRDPVEFDALGPHITNIVKEKANDHIRIWVTGMATGEEAYSLGMLFSEAMAELPESQQTKLQIFATDIDQNAIEIARRGFYPSTALEQVPDELIERYFDKAPSGYSVKKALREKMVFSYHDIAKDPPFLNMDMVSCRNLLIYFQPALQSEVFNRFHYSLVPHGVLFLGKSEALSATENLFLPAGNAKHIFLQRPSQERRAPRDLTFERPQSIRIVQPGKQTVAERDLKESHNRLESLISSMGTCALLINHDMNVIKGYGELEPYVGVSAGVITTKATALVKEPYRHDIQAAVPSVVRNNKVYKGLSRTSPIDASQRERITVYPIENGNKQDILALAVFERWTEETPKTTQARNEKDGALVRQIEDLSNELAIAKTNLQQTVEELETSNEELQALNEELQSSNEELQSTNEELETSNEELQSTNEELSTVNEELQVNASQLSEVNLNLSSILDNVGMPMLVVDKDLQITNMSSIAEEFFGIRPDLSLPHVALCKPPAGFPNMVTALNDAMQTGEPMRSQVSTQDANATLTIIPHFSASNELIGSIILVTDNTDELRQANFELNLIFDNVPAAIMVREGTGKILQANRTALSMLGKSSEEALGTSFYDYFEDDVANEIAEDDRIVVETEEAMEGKTQFVKYRNGKEIWARMNRIPAEHPQSDGQVIYAVTQDITEQQTALEYLQNSEVRLTQAVHSASVGLWDWDIETGDIYMSDLLRSMLSLSEEEAPKTITAFNERLHPDDKETLEKNSQAYLDQKEPLHLTYRMRQGDGTYCWLASYGQMIRNEDGKALRFIGALRDITKERDQLEALREQKEQLELASSLSGVGHWKVDLIANTVFWSHQVHTIHGTVAEKFTPDLESGINFYHADDRDFVRKHIEHAVQAGARFDFEARILRADQEQRTVRAIGVPNLNEKGDATAIFGVFQDITETKEKEVNLTKMMEELERSNEELNRFSYVCSHDMKEPVRMIQSMSSLLTNEKIDLDEQKRAELLTRISTNTSRLSGIIDSLLAYSRIDARVEVTKVDLNNVVDELLESLSLAIESSGAKINHSDLPVLQGAWVHYTQLFHNLVANALKFNDKDEPMIAISSSKTDDGWRLLVEDNGPGIDPQSREEIFNLFSRLHRRDEVEGSGLGLSIAQRIVNQYGGSIRCCDSSLGGVGFEIEFPEVRNVEN